jgi:hypothetical protein
MQYKIYRKHNSDAYPWEKIGQGFMSFNAAWLTVTAYMNVQMINRHINIWLRIERVEDDESQTVVADIILDDTPGKIKNRHT